MELNFMSFRGCSTGPNPDITLVIITGYFLATYLYNRLEAAESVTFRIPVLGKCKIFHLPQNANLLIPKLYQQIKRKCNISKIVCPLTQIC